MGRVTTAISTAIRPPTQLVAALNSRTVRDASAASRRVTAVGGEPRGRLHEGVVETPQRSGARVDGRTEQHQHRPQEADTGEHAAGGGALGRRDPPPRHGRDERAGRPPRQPKAARVGVVVADAGQAAQHGRHPRRRGRHRQARRAPQDTIRAGACGFEPASSGRARFGLPRRLPPTAGRPLEPASGRTSTAGGPPAPSPEWRRRPHGRVPAAGSGRGRYGACRHARWPRRARPWTA